MDNQLKITSGYDGLNLPYSPEAEQSVLGAILLDSSCLDRVMDILPTPDYFHLSKHQTIYAIMLGKNYKWRKSRFCYRSGSSESRKGL